MRKCAWDPPEASIGAYAPIVAVDGAGPVAREIVRGEAVGADLDLAQAECAVGPRIAGVSPLDVAVVPGLRVRARIAAQLLRRHAKGGGHAERRTGGRHGDAVEALDAGLDDRAARRIPRGELRDLRAE